MLTPLLLTCALAPLQDTGPVPPSPYDRVVPVVLDADDPSLEGHGPAEWVEYEVEFSGVLTIWTTSELDTFLRVEEEAGETVGEDEDSGGGTTPFLLLEVTAGTTLQVAVAGSGEDSTGAVSLHLLASPETEETRATARRASEALAEAKERIAAGAFEEAKELLAQTVDELLEPEGARWSLDLATVAWNLGYTANELGDPRRAHRVWSHAWAHQARVLPPDHSDQHPVREVLALTRLSLGDPNGARELLEIVLETYERTLPPDHPSIVRTRTNLAVALSDLGDLHGALALREAVMEANERTLPADHPRLWEDRLNLASTLSSLGEYAEARALGEEVVEALERLLPADHPSLLLARGNLAGTMQRMGDVRSARPLYEAVLEKYSRILPADHPDLLRIKTNLARAMEELGEFRDARVILEEVLEACERSLPPAHPQVIRAHLCIADNTRLMGDLVGARASLEELLESSEQNLSADHPELPRLRSELADTMREMGDILAARALDEAVLLEYERTHGANHPSLLRARLDVASAMQEMGDVPGARALIESVLVIFERSLPADHPDLLATRMRLTSCLKSGRELERARAIEEGVVAAFERTVRADHPKLLVARVNLAVTMGGLGDFARARELLEQVLEAYERTMPATHPDLLDVRLNLANCRRLAGDLSGARAIEETLLAGLATLLPADHRDVLFVRGNLCGTMYLMGDQPGAVAEAEKLAHGMLRRLESISVLAPREVRQAARRDRFNISTVTALLDPGESESRGALAFAILETWRHAVSVPLPATVAGSTEVRARRGEILGLRQGLNDLVAAGIGSDRSAEEFTAEVSRLSLERDRLERGLREILVEQGISLRPIEVAAVASSLPEDAAAIGFRRIRLWRPSEEAELGHRKESRLIAHVVRPDGTLRRVDLGAAAELEAFAEEWRAALGKPIVRGLALSDAEPDLELETGEALRARIFDPVIESLDEKTTRLHVCLDDFLHLVSLEALPLDEGRVGDRWRIVNEVSFDRLLSPRDRPESEPGLLVVGGVDFNAEIERGEKKEGERPASPPPEGDREPRRAGFSPLLQTRFEAEATFTLFDEAFEREAAMLMKKEATKGRFHEIAPGKRFLHLATHGWFAPESVPTDLDEQDRGAAWTPASASQTVESLAPSTLCGLAFAGANRGRDSLGRVPGILTAEELAGTDLSACEMAVLSACETNVGIRRAGQGIQSLQSALHAAGVRTAITSLWKVDDAATRQLMELFYTHLWLEEMGKAEALWRAKCDLRAAGHPVRDWAAWVLSGEWR